MAKVVGPLHSTEARGSVGGLTYNTWRGLRTVKGRGGPAGPATGQRLAMLQLGKAASINWGLLGPDQRDAWNLFGNRQLLLDWTGQHKRNSGHSWYVSCWVRSTLLEQTPPDDPPALLNTWRGSNYGAYHTPQPEGDPPVYYYSIITVSWILADIPPDQQYYVELYLAGPASAGRQLTIHDAVRVGASIADDTYAAANADHNGSYRIFARPVTATGLVGPWFSAPITITELEA